VDEAESEIERKNVISAYDEALATRVTDPATTAEVVIMQRLHEEDLSGHVLDKFGADLIHLCLPMEFDPTLACAADRRTQDRELLWPGQWNRETVEALKIRLGTYAAAGQLNQTPTPRAGGIIARTDWNVYPEEPPDPATARITASGELMLELPPVSCVILALDTAMSEAETADWNACIVWGVWHRRHNAVRGTVGSERPWFAERWSSIQTPADTLQQVIEDDDQPRAIMMEAWRRRCKLNDETIDEFGKPKGLVQRVIDTARRRKASWIVIEDRTRGKDVADELKRQMRGEEFRIYMFDPRKHGDKVARQHSVQPLYSQGLVYAPGKYELVTDVTGRAYTEVRQEFVWVDAVMKEVSAVPRGRHDDLADCCLAKGTRIATRRGDIAVEDITTNDYVFTPIGWRRVMSCGFTGVKHTICRFGLTGTPDHPTFSLDRGYVGLDMIQSRDNLSRLTLCDLIRLILRRPSNLRGLPIALWAEDENIISRNPEAMPPAGGLRGCMLRFGSLITGGRFPWDMRLTTRIMIRLTVILITWSAYRKASIVVFLKTGIKNAIERICGRLRRPPNYGMALSPGWNGTGGTPWSPSGSLGCLSPIQSHPSLMGSASGVVPPMPQRVERENIAARDARDNTQNLSVVSKKYHTDILLRKMALKYRLVLSAFGVGGHSEYRQSAAGPPENFALNRAGLSVRGFDMGKAPIATSIMRVEPVYNLSIEEAECYYANGILVHNCSMGLIFLRENGFLELTKQFIQEQVNQRMVRPRQAAIAEAYGVT
jgi:phage terminase large subunit-like protein